MSSGTQLPCPWGSSLPQLRWFPAPLFVWAPGKPHFLLSSGQLMSPGLVASSSSESVRSLGGGPAAAKTQVVRHAAKGAFCDLSKCDPPRVCAHDFQNSDSLKGRGNLEILAQGNAFLKPCRLPQMLKVFKRSYFF